MWKSKELGNYVLSIAVNKKANHYQIQLKGSGAVLLLDSVNGHREFPSLEDLILFYKSFNPGSKGGLAAPLKECIPPPAQ